MSAAFLNPPGQASFNEVLIKTVRQYPPLYCHQRRPFDNVDRNRIWEEVAAKIGRQVTPEFAKKRWLQLRDRYRKELKIAIAQNFSQPQKWNHFSLLSWLDPHLQGASPIAHCEGAVNGNPFSSQSSNSSSEPCMDLSKSLGLSDQQANEATPDTNACDSDGFDDVKPSLSTLQSVLAATEASADAAAAAQSNIFDITEGDPSGVSPPNKTDTASPSTAFVVNEEQRCAEEAFVENGAAEIFAMNSSSSLKCSNGEVNGAEQLPPVVTVSASRKQAIYAHSNNFAGTPYRCAPFVTAGVRLKNRNYGKIRTSPPSNSQMYSPQHAPPPGPASISPPVDDYHWFNDEEMLFARIVGLRLKKMHGVRRKAVRAKIMQLLDEDVEDDEGATETGASVAE